MLDFPEGGKLVNHTTSTEPDICRCLGRIRRSIRLLELSENTPPELAALLQNLLAAERMLELADSECLEPPLDEGETEMVPQW